YRESIRESLYKKPRPKRKAKKKAKKKGYAGGGKIRKVTRRDVLTGLGAAGATALGAGKAGTKKGLGEVAEEVAEEAMTDITFGEFGPKTEELVKKHIADYYEGVEEIFRDDMYGMDPETMMSYADDLADLQNMMNADPDTPLTKRQAEQLEEVIEGIQENAEFDADVDMAQRANQVMERLGGKPIHVRPKSPRDIDYEKGPQKALQAWEQDPFSESRTKKVLEEYGLDEEPLEMQQHRDYKTGQKEAKEILDEYRLDLLSEERVEGYWNLSDE
ncbi:MAG: hypothetical protein GTO54_07010, partial [Nitrososphaeria archaeon]|nr:hypothetical protein [Nitrososphaeria archaeon]